ncbi:Heat shock protein 70 [Operophtera brumata]|uniref:Heat shock protein 70 n=1 Tax=Operophtera brumata TaxID=104452 RepID=A0A0L7KQR8_OPEBR|nr:Heat shock protein 70 [Operophtera brumata]
MSVTTDNDTKLNEPTVSYGQNLANNEKQRKVTNPSQGVFNEVIEDIGGGVLDMSLDKIRSQAKNLMDKHQEQSKVRFDRHRKKVSIMTLLAIPQVITAHPKNRHCSDTV